MKLTELMKLSIVQKIMDTILEQSAIDILWLKSFIQLILEKAVRIRFRKANFLILQKCLDTKSCRIQKRSQRT